jgi:hypothetical protein
MNVLIRSLRENAGYRGAIIVVCFQLEASEEFKFFPDLNIHLIYRPLADLAHVNGPSLLVFSSLLQSTSYDYYALCDSDLYFIRPIDSVLSEEVISLCPHPVGDMHGWSETSNREFFFSRRWDSINKWIGGGWISGPRKILIKHFEELLKATHLFPDVLQHFCVDEWLFNSFLPRGLKLLDSSKYDINDFILRPEDGVVWYHVLTLWRDKFPYYHPEHRPKILPPRRTFA